MEKSINALLNNNLRVIIPDFGAFIIRQKEPRIVVFNEFLRYNDGILIGYVAKNEGIDLEMAEQLVSDYAGNVAKVLESGKKFTFEGIGSLYKESGGKIIFESEGSTKVQEPVQETEPESPPSADLGESLVFEEAGTLITKADVPKKIKTKKPPVKAGVKRTGKSRTAVRKSAATPSKATSKVKPVDVPGQAEAVKPGPAVEADLPRETGQISVPRPAEPTYTEAVHPEMQHTAIHDIQEEPIPDNQTRLVFRWVAIIVIANAAILAWFIFGEKIRDRSGDKQIQTGMMDSIYQHLSDSVRAAATDTTLIFRETPEIINQDTTPAGATLRYYIVAGCFRDEINADELVKSLKSKGFNAEKFGKIGNLYAVSFASFEDKEMAVSELKKIREEIHPEAWMTRF